MKQNYNLNISQIRLISVLIFTLILSSFSNLYAQKSLSVKHVDHDDFKIDGVLDEPMWQNTVPSSGFYECFPADRKPVEPN